MKVSYVSEVAGAYNSNSLFLFLFFFKEKEQQL